MITDPILEELHQIRELLAAKFNYDISPSSPTFKCKNRRKTVRGFR